MRWLPWQRTSSLDRSLWSFCGMKTNTSTVPHQPRGAEIRNISGSESSQSRADDAPPGYSHECAHIIVPPTGAIRGGPSAESSCSPLQSLVTSHYLLGVDQRSVFVPTPEDGHPGNARGIFAIGGYAAPSRCTHHMPIDRSSSRLGNETRPVCGSPNRKEYFKRVGPGSSRQLPLGRRPFWGTDRTGKHASIQK